MSIWFFVAPCMPVKFMDAVLTESIVSLYRRKEDTKKNAFSGVRD